MLAGFLIFAAGFGWLWWNYDGGHRLGALAAWYWATYGDLVIIGVVSTLFWLVIRDVKRARRPRRGRRV